MSLLLVSVRGGGARRLRLYGRNLSTQLGLQQLKCTRLSVFVFCFIVLWASSEEVFCRERGAIVTWFDQGARGTDDANVEVTSRNHL